MPRYPRLLAIVDAEMIDAALISHGHPDHCADLHPLLRARSLREEPAKKLDIYTLPGAVDRVVALDRPGMLDSAYSLHEFAPGDSLRIGPFRVRTWLLSHSMANAGLRLSVNGHAVAYTGDSGPSPRLAELARGTDLFIAEATYPFSVPPDSAAFLSSARYAAEVSTNVGVKHLMLTHLWPNSDPTQHVEVAADRFSGLISVATFGEVVDISN